MQTITNPPYRTLKNYRSVVGNSVEIAITPAQIEIKFGKTIDSAGIFRIEVWREGQLLSRETVTARRNFSALVPRGIDSRECGVRVCNANGITVAELDVEEDLYPFMRRPTEQQHITENYVSVPPALTITDEAGDVWTLGMTAAPHHQSPEGEFAFGVVRNGARMGEVASRIERRNGKVRIFTVHGWKTWNSHNFF